MFIVSSLLTLITHCVSDYISMCHLAAVILNTDRQKPGII